MILHLATSIATHQYPPEKKCCWPQGNPGEPGFSFCHREVKTPGPYCDDCRRTHKPYRQVGERYE